MISLQRDRAQELVAELELPHGVGLHPRLEHADAAALGGLRPVHRGVGVAQQALGIAATGGDADAGPDAQLVSVDVQRLGERLDDALPEDLRCRRVFLVRDQDGELVAAEAGRRLGAAQALADALRGLDQEPVAGEVAEAVVHELELVDVEEEHRDLAVGPLRPRERVVESIDEEGAIREARERIGQRLADRVGRSRRREGDSGVFGEEAERVGVPSVNWWPPWVATTRLPTISPWP